MNYSADGRPFNIRDDLREKSPDEIREIYAKSSQGKAAVMCLNVTGEPNIGMIIRTASLFAFSQVFIVGRKHYDKRSTVGMYNYIPIEFENATLGHHSESLNLPRISQILDEFAQKYHLIVVEQTPTAIQLQHLHKQTFPAGKPPLFIMGSESEGIPVEILSRSDILTVSIPQWGVGRSFNVANAFSMIAWEWMKIENNL